MRAGQTPTYDHALAYIRADAAAMQVGADALRPSIEKGMVPTEDVGDDAKKRLDVLEVMVQINLLEARWKIANGIAELSQKVCGHLVKQHWRNEGALDLLIRCFTSPFS